MIATLPKPAQSLGRIPETEIRIMIKAIETDFGLKYLPLNTLAALCQRLGQSGRGNRMQLTNRLLKQIR